MVYLPNMDITMDNSYKVLQGVIKILAHLNMFGYIYVDMILKWLYYAIGTRLIYT